MRPVFLKSFDKKPLIMYGKKDNVFCLFPKIDLSKNADIVAYKLKKVILPIPFKKYALVREGEYGGEYGEVYTFSDLMKIPKKQKEGKKIYALKRLDDIDYLCPDKIE